MTSFLFPVIDLVGGARSKNDVAPFLSDIARATADSADALVLFKNLIEGHCGDPESPGFMAFDAHGGEYVQFIISSQTHLVFALGHQYGHQLSVLEEAQ